MVAPHLSYPPVPLNTLSHTNLLSLQVVQNKALRWINSDTPTYTTTIKILNKHFKINIILHQAASRVWDTPCTYEAHNPAAAGVRQRRDTRMLEKCNTNLRMMRNQNVFTRQPSHKTQMTALMMKKYETKIIKFPNKNVSEIRHNNTIIKMFNRLNINL